MEGLSLGNRMHQHASACITCTLKPYIHLPVSRKLNQRASELWKPCITLHLFQNSSIALPVSQAPSVALALSLSLSLCFISLTPPVRTRANTRKHGQLQLHVDPKNHTTD